MNRVVVFAANRGYALRSSREALIRRFVDAEWQVVLVTAADEDARWLRSLGAELAPVVFSRGGLSLRADLRAYRRLRQIYGAFRPTLVHHFHAKPVILGTLAARAAMGEPVRIVNTITGLGHAFVAGGIAAELAGLGYRLALPKADRTIFQNRDDMALFLRRKWLAAEQACLIAGSGVRLDRYSDTDRSARDAHTPTILMLGRLLNQKGIPEFVEVGKRIRAEFPDARFLLAGEEDAMHPGSVDIGWLRNQAHVEYLGHVQDVRPLLGQADLMLFPSYYREGVPRVIMEAAATGLPTVGFDVPGVREAVIDGETGFLVKERDLDALTERTARLLGDRKLRLKFGKKARTLAEDAFDIEKIQAEYCCIYADLGASV